MSRDDVDPRRRHDRCPLLPALRAARSLAILGLLLLVPALASAALQQDGAGRLLPIPEVSLETVEPAVREQLTEQRRRLDAAVDGYRQGRGPSEQQLGALYGETGQLYLVYDLIEVAEACLLNAARLDPRARWHYLLGSIYRLDRRTEEAIDSYRWAVEFDPEDASARARLAEMLLTDSRFDDARAELERLRGVPGFEAWAAYGLGRVAAESGEPETALERYEQALELQPQASVVHYHRGMAYRALGDRKAMREALEQRGDQEVRFPDPVAFELQQAATGVGAWLSMGRLSLDVGRFDLAEERFRRAIQIDPQSAAAWRALASALQRQNRIDAAIEAYERAARLEPEDAGLRYFLAQLLVDHPKPDGSRDRDAIDHLEAVLEQTPDFLPAWVELAGASERLGRLDEAERALAKAVELEPEAHDLRLHRAGLLNRTGDPESARRELQAVESAAEAALQTDEGWSPENAYRLGRTWLELGETDTARRWLEQASEEAESVGTRALGLFQLGNLAAGDDPEAAIGLYRAALDLQEALTEARFNLATLLGRQGRFLEAADEHALVLTQTPGDHRARFSQAMALILGADHAQARERLGRALELYPDQAPYAHLLARLLVTAPESEVRDAQTGLRLAEQVFQAFPTPEHGETLAMALAENGRFAEAMSVQERAVEEWRRAGRESEARLAAARLERLRAEQPIRTPWRD